MTVPSDHPCPDRPSSHPLVVDLPGTTWPPDTLVGREPVDLFDVTRDLAARYYRTNRGVSNGFLDGADPDPSSIPMGYTQLFCDEQIAVAIDGEIVHRWTARATSETYVILLPQTATQTWLVVRAGHPERYAEKSLLNLSARLPSTPLLLSRQRSEQAWH